VKVTLWFDFFNYFFRVLDTKRSIMLNRYREDLRVLLSGSIDIKRNLVK